MRTAEHRAHQLERAAPAIAENKRLLESVEALEKSLPGARSDNEKVQARVTQLESENLKLTNQLSTAEAELTRTTEHLGKLGSELASVAERKNGKMSNPMTPVFCYCSALEYNPL